MNDINVKLGMNIRAARKRRHLSSEALSAMLGGGISGRTLRHYENGERAVDVPTLIRIATALETSVQTLMHGLDSRTAEDGVQEYELLTPAEHEVFRFMATEWSGNRHALIVFDALYMALPPKYRREAPLSLLTQVELAISNGDINRDDLPPDIGYMEEAWRQLYREKRR